MPYLNSDTTLIVTISVADAQVTNFNGTNFPLLMDAPDEDFAFAGLDASECEWAVPAWQPLTAPADDSATPVEAIVIGTVAVVWSICVGAVLTGLYVRRRRRRHAKLLRFEEEMQRKSVRERNAAIAAQQNEYIATPVV